MSAPDLLPCPFCGGEAHLNRQVGGSYVPRCQGCLISGRPSFTSAGATKEWNRRDGETERVVQAIMGMTDSEWEEIYDGDTERSRELMLKVVRGERQSSS